MLQDIGWIALASVFVLTTAIPFFAIVSVSAWLLLRNRLSFSKIDWRVLLIVFSLVMLAIQIIANATWITSIDGTLVQESDPLVSFRTFSVISWDQNSAAGVIPSGPFQSEGEIAQLSFGLSLLFIFFGTFGSAALSGRFIRNKRKDLGIVSATLFVIQAVWLAVVSLFALLPLDPIVIPGA